MTPRTRWIIPLLSACVVASAMPVAAAQSALATSLSGRILLQVEEHGEGWYVDPVTRTRYYLGRPADAFVLMRAKGLGIRHAELGGYLSARFPSRLAGRILLDVEAHGEAYYVLPQNLTARFLGRPADAFALMRSLGLGIRNGDLVAIPVASDSALPPASTDGSDVDAGVSNVAMEQRVFDLINAHRQSVGLPPLAWNETVAGQARTHSANMAAGRVSFGHDGFLDRVKAIAERISIDESGENVALNDAPDPVATVIDQWLNSSGHRANIEHDPFNQTGIGAVRGADGAVYFTQIFVQTN